MHKIVYSALGILCFHATMLGSYLPHRTTTSIISSRAVVQEKRTHLESVYKSSTTEHARLNAAFLLGKSYFEGYATHASKQQGVDPAKALFYLSFLSAHPDSDMERQAESCLMLSKIYATGIRGWCGWKVPADDDLAQHYLEKAQFFKS